MTPFLIKVHKSPDGHVERSLLSMLLKQKLHMHLLTVLFLHSTTARTRSLSLLSVRREGVHVQQRYPRVSDHPHRFNMM